MKALPMKTLLVLLLSSFWAVVASADTSPQRIVSAGGDITEIIYALGAGDRVIGVDSTSNYPASAKDKEQIGYVRRISSEGILSLQPDLVLGAYDTGPQASVDQLRAAGVAVELAPEAESPDGVLEKIRFVGKAIGETDKAEALALKVESDLARELKKVAGMESNPRVIFIFSVGNGGPVAAGDNNVAQRIIELSGGVNAVTGFNGFKPLSREAILEAQPDVLLMMESAAGRYGGTQKVLSLPEFALTPAGQNKRAIEMDGMKLLGFGPRLPEAVAELSAGLQK
ncbi:heme/hemin ABC transporter substrate-binding protein [Rhodovibrionaceae bacterium A322]